LGGGNNANNTSVLGVSNYNSSRNNNIYCGSEKKSPISSSRIPSTNRNSYFDFNQMNNSIDNVNPTLTGVRTNSNNTEENEIVSVKENFILTNLNDYSSTY